MRDERRQRAYIRAVLGLGAIVLATRLYPPNFGSARVFAVYLGIVIVSSVLKIKLPGLTSNLSPNIIPILVGIAQLTSTESVLLGCAGTLTQCLWHAKKFRWRQFSFNVAVAAIAAGSSGMLLYAVRGIPGVTESVAFAVLAVAYFTMNTLPVCTVIALTEHKRVIDLWREVYAASFPLFILSAVAAGMYSASSNSKWVVIAATLPLFYFVYRAYCMFLKRLQEEKNNAASSASLNMRTMEALVAAIDAKDGASHERFKLIQTLAVEAAKQLELPEEDVNALAAAALLRDIGNMAIPEHLLARPDKLTAAEMERVQAHVAVGVEILERVNFPFPVVPIVRAHHEKWDGSGYPNGLKGNEIPLAARILSAVDTLVSLISERPHRAALTIDEAMAAVQSEANRSFDPNVVAVLQRQYSEIQAAVNSPRNQDLTHAGWLNPETGVSALRDALDADSAGNPLSSISRAKYEDQIIAPSDAFLTLKESLAVFAIRLNRVVPHDVIVIHLQASDRLVPEYVNGEDAKIFSSADIPIGEGISGWVAESGKSSFNADPADELAALGSSRPTNMRSALSVPLESVAGRRGVLTVYRTGKNAFSLDDLRVLLSIRLKVLNWELHGLASEALLAHASSSAIQAESEATRLAKAFV